MTDDRVTELRATRAQEVWWTVHRDNHAEPVALPRRLDDVDDIVVAARRLRVPLDPAVVVRCLEVVAGRHEALRTGLVRRGDELLQRIEPAPSLALRVLDLVGVDPAQATREIQAATLDELRGPFALERPRHRAILARLGDADHVLVVTVLHSLFDDFSHQLLIGELRALYQQALGGTRALPASVPFRRFSDWQRDWQRDAQLVAQREYWCRQLDGYRSEIALPVRRPRSEVTHDTRSSVRVAVAPERWRAAVAVARAERVTPFALVIAVLAAVLAEHAGQDEVAIATVYGNRRLPWMRSIMGLLANTLVLRTSFAGNPTVRGAIQQVARDWLDALSNGELPFDELARDLGRTRLAGPGTTPAYEALVNFHVPAAPTPDDRPDWMQPWAPPEDDRPAQWAGCLLYVTLWVTADGALDARFRHADQLLAADVVTAIATRFQALVAAIPELLDVSVARLGGAASAP